MTHEELKVIFEAQADQRRRDAEEYAAEIFERLAATAADAPVHLLNAYSDVFARAAHVSNAALNDAVEHGGPGVEKCRLWQPPPKPRLNSSKGF